VPTSCDRDYLTLLLERQFHLASSLFKIASLAIDPENSKSQIATLSVNDIPDLLNDGKDEWIFQLSFKDLDPDLYDHTLVFDTHFRSFTPLNSVSSGIEPKFE
jgi:hypothetical protein